MDILTDGTSVVVRSTKNRSKNLGPCSLIDGCAILTQMFFCKRQKTRELLQLPSMYALYFHRAIRHSPLSAPEFAAILSTSLDLHG